jgi:hypothetical protein
VTPRARLAELGLDREHHPGTRRDDHHFVAIRTQVRHQLGRALPLAFGRAVDGVALLHFLPGDGAGRQQAGGAIERGLRRGRCGLGRFEVAARSGQLVRMDLHERLPGAHPVARQHHHLIDASGNDRTDVGGLWIGRVERPRQRDRNGG